MCWCDVCGDVDTICDCEVCDRHRCSRCNVLLTEDDHEHNAGELAMWCMGCIETGEFEAVERSLIGAIAAGMPTHGIAVSFRQHCEGRWPSPEYEFFELRGRVVAR
jgi:hypothetical protein